MGRKLYEPEEIDNASGKIIDSADPETSFFLGPTSESDMVYVFDNKLEALFFLKSYFENYLSKAEKNIIRSQIKTIRKNRSDISTLTLTDLFEKNESIEIYAEGYWDDFVPTSQPFWKEWMINSGDILSESEFWSDDEVELPDDISESDEDFESQHLLFSEAPEDVFNPEFVDSFLKIIPLA
ncbi:MAG: hypothetical protein JSW04_04425 [Desulfobacterales bacterium]|nr:MAG: hypothetical protein JSW04_04425 [Desulfobacterales bacterium]